MAKIEIDSPQRMTPAQAAKYIACSEYTIRDLARQKRIPHYRIGNRIMFSCNSLKAWVEQQEEENSCNIVA